MSYPTTTRRPATATAPSTAPAGQVPATFQRAPSMLAELRTEFEAPDRLAQLEGVLPPSIPRERFVSVVIMAVQQTPALLNADRQSLFKAAVKAASDGLLPDGREAALVPFKGQVTYIPMVQGILKKVRNSGQLKHITANLVHEGDHFRFYVDERGEHLQHEPNLELPRLDDTVRLAYALAVTVDGGTYIEVMTVQQIERVRSFSRASREDSPWNQHWGEMARKTVLKRLSKRLPMSTDLREFLDRVAPDPDDPVARAVEVGDQAVIDASVDEAARAARTREKWRREDAAKGYAPRGARPGPQPQAGPAAGNGNGQRRAGHPLSGVWPLWRELFGLPAGEETPEARTERIRRTVEILELPEDRAKEITSWRDLDPEEIRELEYRLRRRLAAEKEAAAAAGPDDPDDDMPPAAPAPSSGREPGDEDDGQPSMFARGRR